KQVEGILRDDQKPLLANFKDEVGLGEANAVDAKAGSTDVRGILQMAKRLKLNSSQKDELKDIEKDALKAWKQAGRDKEARTDLAQQVRDEIAKMLDQTQRDRFEELLQRADKRSSTKR